MFNEFEKEDDSWRPDPPKWTVITKKALSYAFGVFAVALIGFLVLRMILSQPPKAMKQAVWDDTLFGAYQTAKAENRDFELNQISTPNSFSESSMFSVYTILYSPEAKQLQLTVRYNNRALNYLTQDYPEAKALVESGSEIYVFNLSYTKNDSQHTLDTYKYVKDEKAGYTYYRLIFNGVELDGVAAMTVNACYVGRPTVSEEAMSVYSAGYSVIPFDFKAPKGVTRDIKQK